MILQMLRESSKKRVEVEKSRVAPSVMKNMALQLPKGDERFQKVLAGSDVSFICEVKKASPSKGIICQNFRYSEIALEYERAGADAISVLTEPEYFMGSDLFLSEISKMVKIPVLRKDFTVDEYQIYQAKVLGADAVLLICAILSPEQLTHYLGICDELGISALVEAHDEKEIAVALKAGAKIVGVNNRNLNNFHVDVNNSLNLRKLVPDSVIFVSESGIQSNEDVIRVKEAGGNAVLIGETLMKSSNKMKTLNQLKGIANEC